MARVAAEPQNSREADVEGDAPARDRASVVSAARKMEKMAPRVPPHVSVTKINELISRGNGDNENEKCVLTIDKFCEDTENFDNLSVGAEAIVDSVKDGYRRNGREREDLKDG